MSLTQSESQINQSSNSKSKLYPSNPLGIIATFVFFIEAINATSLHLLKDHPILLERIVWFIICFPVVIALAFFGILIKKREALFAPGDFKDELHFLSLFKRVRSLEIDQKVQEVALEPPTDITSVLKLADELIVNNELKSAIRMGRSYLKAKEFNLARKYFKHLKRKASKTDVLYFRVLSNLAYAEIALKKFDTALENLKSAEVLLGDRIEVWQLSALAITYNQLGQTQEAESYKQKTLAHPAFQNAEEALKRLYDGLGMF